MIILAGAVIGIVLGIYLARRNQGSVLDMAQYAAASGIAFTLLGLIITVVIHRMAVG